MHFNQEYKAFETSLEALDAMAHYLIELQLLDMRMWKHYVRQGQETHQHWVRCLLQNQNEETEKISAALADFMQIEWVDLTNFTIDDVIKDVADIKFIQEHQVLPLNVSADKRLCVAMAEPMQLGVMREIKFHTDLVVFPVMVDWKKLARLINMYVNNAQYSIINSFQFEVASLKKDAQIVQFVQHILLDANEKKASDVHLEPYKTAYRLRFRIDGILRKIAQIPEDVALRVTARLKVLSKLDIAERRLPQDGRFVLELNDQNSKDCRISTCPTLFGEKTVVRLLDGGKSALQIEDLGLDEAQKNIFLKAIARPQGMILVTGPTGSGKTQTLYTAIEILNTLERNISTVEDPVEIQLPGINQVNIHLKTGLTFSKALRAFLRQDPDVIMIGEIRDQETAEIALKAAQTGHLVFSTLHTNSTIETIMRLQSMGLSLFNIIHSIHLVVAQRLLRKLCDRCKKLVHLPTEKYLSFGADAEFLQMMPCYIAVGCEYCVQGYNGRTAVFEILPMEEKIEKKIMQGATINELMKISRANGMLSLQAAAFNKIKMGITSLEEMCRVMG